MERHLYISAAKKLKGNFLIDLPADSSIDMIGWEQSSIIFDNFNYRPRPVFQEYSDYTYYLINKNKAFYKASPPENILFSPRAIDGRPPTMSEGALWPNIFENYHIAEYADNEFILFKRNQIENPAKTKSIFQKDAEFNNTIPLPEEPGLIYLKIKIDKTLLGKLFSLLYRPPLVYIYCYKNGNLLSRNRLVTAIAQEGFFVSPLIRNNEVLIGTFSGKNITRPDAIKISYELPDFGWIYADKFHIEATRYIFDKKQILPKPLNSQALLM